MYPKVYLGGAIDYANLDPNLHTRDDWQHGDWLPSGIITYCPFCEAREKARWGEPLKPDWLIMQGNNMALASADAVVAVFDRAVPTFGTPIEVYNRVRRAPGSVFLLHRGKPGLFVRDMAANKEITLGESFEEAALWLTSYLNLQPA